MDKARTYEALTEIFTDFLTHWGKTLDTFSEHHEESLRELTNRTITRMNSARGEPPSVFIQADLTTPGARSELAAGILKAVEQELRAARSTEGTNATDRPLTQLSSHPQ
jgi:hypothetical protein